MRYFTERLAGPDLAQTIQLGASTLPAARCPICPGGVMIFPPEALDAHIARHEGTKVQCRVCRNLFVRARDDTRFRPTCPKCRVRKRVHVVGKKRACGSGVEKRDAISLGRARS